MKLSIEDRLRTLIAELAYGSVSCVSISHDSLLNEDIGLDELDRVDMYVTIEDEFSIALPDDIDEHVRTFGELVHFVEITVAASQN